MRFVRGARVGLVLTCLPIFSIGCASLSPKLGVLPSIARNRADLQFQTAQNAERHGQWQKARELYLTLQRNSPNNPLYSQRMGVACTQLGDFETAGKYFEHARSLDPQNSVLLSDMGYSHYLQRDYDQAEKLLTESVRLKPDDARAINNLAMTIGFQGRYDESLATFQRVNNEIQSLLNVAYIHVQKNEPEQAIALYQRVLAVDPANRIATNAIQQVRSGRPTMLVVTNRMSLTVTRTSAPAASSSPDSSRLPPEPASIPAEIPAAPRDLSEDLVSTAVNPAMSAVVRPVITSAAEIEPPEDFQPPIITLFNGHEEAVVKAPISQPEELKVALADTVVELPRQLPVEPPVADPAPAVAEPPPQILDKPVDDQPPPPVDALSNVFVEGEEPAKKPGETSGDEVTDLEWAQPELAKQSAAANSEVATETRKDDCFRGFCPVAIRNERRLRSSSDKFSVEFHGQTYHFASSEALIEFQENPEWYVPMAGGLDVVDFKRDQSVSHGSLDNAVWFRHRLHMFSTAENLAVFRANPRQFAVKP